MNELFNFDNDTERINQVKINNRPSIHIDPFLNIGRSIYKVKCGNHIGTGFLFKTIKGIKNFYCLITCEHVITKDMIEKKKTIFCKNKYGAFTIILDKTRIFIRDYTYMNIDATLIEIFPEKLNLPITHFLLPESKFLNNFEAFNNLEVYIAHFLPNNEVKINYGNIIGINKFSFQFIHNIDTQYGSSGGPIFEKNSMFILGIHKQGSLVEKKNYASFIYPIVDSLKNNNDYVSMRYFKREDSIYEGEMRNNFCEGYGKIINENGYYYKGQWSKGKRQGFGVEFSKDDNIIY